MIIYFDSVIVIYLFDGTPPFSVRAETRLIALETAGDAIAISDLTRLECRVKPIRDGSAARLAHFDAFFARSDLHRLPLATAVYDRATLIRAMYNFRLADSLHLAAAVEARCDRFLTNDTRLSSFPDIVVEVLP
jgi:predicted nucleic acid-binding protein